MKIKIDSKPKNRLNATNLIKVCSRIVKANPMREMIIPIGKEGKAKSFSENILISVTKPSSKSYPIKTGMKIKKKEKKRDRLILITKD